VVRSWHIYAAKRLHHWKEVPRSNADIDQAGDRVLVLCCFR